MSEPIRKLSPEELASKNANKIGHDAKKSLLNPEALRGDESFRLTVPSAIEGGGEPKVVDAKTTEAIKAFVAEDAVVAGGVRGVLTETAKAEALLGQLNEGNLNGGTAASQLVDYLNSLSN